MYPVLPFINGEYSWDDLPDTVQWDVGSPGSIILQKQPIGTIDPIDGAKRVYYATKTSIFGIDEFRITDEFFWPPGSTTGEIYKKWQIQTTIDSPEGWQAFCGEVTGGDCLIGVNGCGAGIFDQFASIYSVSGPVSGLIDRVEPNEDQFLFDVNCRYSGTGLSLVYNSTTYKWQLNGNPKIGFQNTPVGSYEGGYSVS
jgi:hypothetical protein